jgi:hypothetical protein
VNEGNILTLTLKPKLTLFLGVNEENILTLKLKLTLFFCGFEYERFYSGLFFTCSRGAQAQTHTHAVFLRMKEENILTLKLKLTL